MIVEQQLKNGGKRLKNQKFRDDVMCSYLNNDMEFVGIRGGQGAALEHLERSDRFCASAIAWLSR